MGQGRWIRAPALAAAVASAPRTDPPFAGRKRSAAGERVFPRVLDTAGEPFIAAEAETPEFRARHRRPYYGATGWTVLNAAGDRQYADFDFWAVRPSGSTHAWTRVAGYETRSGTLSR